MPAPSNFLEPLHDSGTIRFIRLCVHVRQSKNANPCMYVRKILGIQVYVYGKLCENLIYNYTCTPS